MMHTAKRLGRARSSHSGFRGMVEALETRRLLATVPSGFGERAWGASVTNGTAMAFAPDGRLFVGQQGGQLRVIQDGALLATPFATFSTTSVGERGLLGVAFDPNFASNGYVYVYYTVPTSPIHNRVSRVTADPNNPDVMLAGSEHVLLDLNSLSTATNHNGGAIHFGPDGKLYITVGENANGANAQSFGNLLGKALRMNADGSVPTDNPYFNDPNVLGQNKLIWSLGLRNPFTFAFQPGTGKMFINDVGAGAWEEINQGVAHSNYGWPGIEGVRTTQSPPTDYRDPLLAYDHFSSQSAITGGTFYNPPAANVRFPSQYQGKYFFNDLGAGWTHYMDPNNAGAGTQSFASGALSPVDIHTGPDGALFYLMRGGSAPGVYRIGVNDSTAPAVTSSSFLVQTSQRLQFNFNDYVGFSLAKADVTVQNLTTNTTLSASQYTLTFDPETNIATLRFNSTGPNGSIANGNYRATIAAAGVTDGAGNAMTANHVLNFYALAGDANRDRVVDLADFTILAANYNKTGQDFGHGNFDYDSSGTVNLSDFTLLANNFNVLLSAPAAAPAARVAMPMSVARGVLPPAPSTAFSDHRIDHGSELPGLADDVLTLL